MLGAEVEPRSRTHRLFSVSLFSVSLFSVPQVRASSPRPLERRVSLCDACAGEFASGPPDEPRNSFMKFCVTDAIITSLLLLRGFCFRFPLDIDLAFKVSAFFDGDTL